MNVYFHLFFYLISQLQVRQHKSPQHPHIVATVKKIDNGIELIPKYTENHMAIPTAIKKR
jgi:hypothetical protein